MNFRRLHTKLEAFTSRHTAFIAQKVERFVFESFKLETVFRKIKLKTSVDLKLSNDSDVDAN